MVEQRRLSRTEAAIRFSRQHSVPFTVAVRPNYRPAWYHWTIGDYLQRVTSGEITRLIICLPPRHGKSELTSKTFPAWYLGKYSDKEVMVASYSSDLATKFGRSNRNTVNLPIYSRIFPDAQLSVELGKSASEWGLTNGSYFVSAGIRGGFTGKGARIFFIDDPYKNAEEANSAVVRERVKDFYKEVALPRLTPDGAIVIVMTRWHYDDLVGWLLREWPEEDWVVANFPAIKEEDPTDLDPREPGQVLWIDQYDKDYIVKRREEIGPTSFMGLYQQVPQSKGAGILKIEWLVQDFDLPWQGKEATTVISWDTAFEKHSRADYSVGTVWKATATDYYLVDLVRGRYGFPDLRKVMVALADKHNPDAVLIERAASGRDIYYELRESTDLPLIPIKVLTDKVQRADAVSGRFEAERVHVPRKADWLADFMTELDRFPKGVNDDIVDSTTQAISWMSKRSGREAIAA